jgi:hypothetical protein
LLIIPVFQGLDFPNPLAFKKKIDLSQTLVFHHESLNSTKKNRKKLKTLARIWAVLRASSSKPKNWRKKSVKIAQKQVQIALWSFLSTIRPNIDQKALSLCDISKISISSNNGIPNYQYRDIDSCLTDSSIFYPFVRPLVGQIISWKSRQKRLKSGAVSRFFAEHKVTEHKKIRITFEKSRYVKYVVLF